MISAFFNDLMPLVVFIYTVSWLLAKKKCIDHLGRYLWMAFFLIIPLSAFFSLTAFRETANEFLIRLIVFAASLSVLQLLGLMIPYLPLFLRSPANFVRSFFYDAFAFLSFLILFRYWSWKKTPKKNLANDGLPILLIHGYGHDSGAWVYLMPIFTQWGIGPIYTIDLGSANKSIIDYAKRIQEMAKAITYETNKTDLFLIGYSMGGLAASYYAFHLAQENTIKGIITLGTPLNGTKTAKLGYGACCQEMAYQSPFVEELKIKIANNQKIPFWHIGSHSDTIVFPAASAWLQGKNSQNIFFEEKGHLSLLYSKRIADCFYRILSTLSRGSE